MAATLALMELSKVLLNENLYSVTCFFVFGYLFWLLPYSFLKLSNKDKFMEGLRYTPTERTRDYVET